MNAWLYVHLGRPVALLLAAGAVLFILAIVTEPLWRDVPVAAALAGGG